MTEKRCEPYVKKIERLQVQNEDLLKINVQLRTENKALKSDRDYWKTLAQSLAKNNGGFKR